MNELPPGNSPSTDTEQRSRSLRALLLTLVLTSFTVTAEPIRNVVSMNATVAAVTIGVIAGVVASVALDRFQFPGRNDVRTTIAAFVSTGIATVLVWVLVPTGLLQTVPQFGLAFLWSFSTVSVTRDVLWPTAMDSVET